MSEQLSLNNEDWRLRQHAGRPVKEHDTQEGRYVERESQLPEHLYRQIPVEDLFLTWRDREMPLQHFIENEHSQVEGDSVGNFWFSEPLLLNNKPEVYIVTKPSEWEDSPEYVQESRMAFKSDKSSEVVDGRIVLKPGENLSYVTEIHTGNRVKLNNMTIFLFNETHNKLRKEADMLAQLESITVDNFAQYKDLFKRAEKLFEREYKGRRLFGAPPSEIDELYTKLLQDVSFQQSLRKFYAWALALPVIRPEVELICVNDRPTDEDAYTKQAGYFKEFYKAVKNS